MTNNRMNRKAILAGFGLAILGLVAAAPGHAGVDTLHTTQLTFSKPFGLPGVTLGAGTYIFERASETATDVVRISSRDRRFVYYMGFTDRVDRPRGVTSPVTFGEAPKGAAQPVREWYPTGSSVGHRFRYR